MSSHRNDTYQQLLRARHFMREHYASSLDLDQIARQASFSRYHFLRLFRETFHQTPHQYLVQRRIECAKTLLATGDLSITEVCFEVGFQSLGSFSTLFHRCTGYPPKAYRARVFQGIDLERRFVPTCFFRGWQTAALISR
ncbi:MAG: AraC family transcriptional regulator [Chloroflexota bacterium]